MTQLAEGDLAPDFTLPDGSGGTLALHELRGREVILFFYPKDDTPGCTKEACSFRDAHDALAAANAIVLGVSPDDVDSHEHFAAKYDLTFPLLADTDHQVAAAYGTWGEKSLYGRRYMGIHRTTFLIGPDGKIRKIWRKVNPVDHSLEVLHALSA